MRASTIILSLGALLNPRRELNVILLICLSSSNRFQGFQSVKTTWTVPIRQAFQIITTPLSINSTACWRKDSSPEIARVLHTAAHADRLGSSLSLSPSHGLGIISCQQFNQSADSFQELAPPRSRPEFRTGAVLDTLAFIKFSGHSRRRVHRLELLNITLS